MAAQHSWIAGAISSVELSELRDSMGVNHSCSMEDALLLPDIREVRTFLPSTPRELFTFPRTSCVDAIEKLCIPCHHEKEAASTLRCVIGNALGLVTSYGGGCYYLLRNGTVVGQAEEIDGENHGSKKAGGSRGRGGQRGEGRGGAGGRRAGGKENVQIEKKETRSAKQKRTT